MYDKIHYNKNNNNNKKKNNRLKKKEEESPCYKPQGQTHKGVRLGSWKHEPWNIGLAPGMIAA